MPIILGIESTAHTFGVGIVKNGKILANINKTYTTESGGIIPIESAKHHYKNKNDIYLEALDKSKVKEKDINAIAFSQGPGLAPCLLEGMKFAKHLSKKLNKPIVPVHHCIAHLEIGKITKAKDPVMLYVSGANTQIIAYESGKYRIFGETLDIGVGNFIDNFARFIGVGFPGGPTIEKLAKSGKNYIELPYKVKGMDVALSGILTNLKQKIEKINMLFSQLSKKLPVHLHLQVNKHKLINNSSGKSVRLSDNNKLTNDSLINNFRNKCNSDKINDKILLIGNKKLSEHGELGYTISNLCYSMQETVFAMLVETAERALAHTGKKELLLGGGVACNSRLQEMCRIMCEERNCKLFVPEKQFLVDNGAMIAFLGEIMYKKNIFENNLKKIDIKPRQRTDEVDVRWR